MSKKDRIAVVLSIPYLIFCLFGAVEAPAIGLILGIPLFIYWGYRFVKNDISFLKAKEKND